MRKITVGKYPINNVLIHTTQRLMSVPDSPSKIEFTTDGLLLGESDGIIATLSDVNITENKVLKFITASDTFTSFQPATDAINTSYILPPQDGTDSQSIVTDGSGNLRWESTKYLYSVKTGGFTAESWNAYFIDTTGGTIAATLPLDPSMGDTIRFFDVASQFDTNPLVMVRNGEKIMGDDEDMQVTTANAAFDIVYSNETYGWRIITV